MSYSFLENLIPALKEKRIAEELALQVEAHARQLSGLSTIESNNAEIIAILKSACLLLERLCENQPTQRDSEGLGFTTHSELLENHLETLKTEKITPSESKAEIKIEEVKIPPESPPITQIVTEKPPEKPSVTANELIRLRDWVLLANTGDSEQKASPKVLDAIYKQLGKILEKEGITTLEETGKFNYERHQVISTQLTDELEKDDLIYDTVRPGYLFHDQLIRSQEVIVYQLTK